VEFKCTAGWIPGGPLNNNRKATRGFLLQYLQPLPHCGPGVREAGGFWMAAARGHGGVGTRHASAGERSLNPLECVCGGAL